MIHNFINETTYDMQTHRCHQCSLESHHSGQRSEHIEDCCTESLHLSMRLCICNNWWRVALREPKGTSIPTYFMWIGNLRQFLSSLPSEHVLVPVHREEAEMHWPLVHWNWVELQPKLCAELVKTCSCKTLKILSETPHTDDIPQYTQSYVNLARRENASFELEPCCAVHVNLL